MRIPMDPPPSAWKPFVRDHCNACWAHCCRLPLEVSAQDLIRMGLATEEECADSLKKVASKLKKSHVIESYRAKSQIFVIERKASGDCKYLDSKTRSCTVYDTRPRVCREFPEKIGVRPGFCPYIKA